MKRIFINIDGVLRNLIQKFEYHYKDNFFDSETETNDNFIYDVESKINNDDLFKYFKFQSKEEYENFRYIDFPLEIYGHAGVSYTNVFNDLNNLIYENKKFNITLIGVDELGKSKSATLFFLSKNGSLSNKIEFIKSKEIKKKWKQCDIWITDNEEIIKMCPDNKKAIKFSTVHNQYFDYDNQITKISEFKLQ
jgi:NADH/NAD ratio-sensing transcriptional regulator Rex